MFLLCLSLSLSLSLSLATSFRASIFRVFFSSSSQFGQLVAMLPCHRSFRGRNRSRIYQVYTYRYSRKYNSFRKLYVLSDSFYQNIKDFRIRESFFTPIFMRAFQFHVHVTLHITYLHVQRTTYNVQPLNVCEGHLCHLKFFLCFGLIGTTGFILLLLHGFQTSKR